MELLFALGGQSWMDKKKLFIGSYFLGKPWWSIQLLCLDLSTETYVSFN